MVTTALDYWESDYAVGRRHVDFTGRNSTPDVGAMNDRDAQMYWRVIRGGFIIHREHKILDFQWLGLDADEVRGQAWDRAGNKGSWVTYTFSVTANEDADWVRYVDTGGNDTTGNGTEGNPWATVTKAVTEAQSALTSGQVGVIFLSDDQTWAHTATLYSGGDATSRLVRFVRKGGGTNRPILTFSAGTTGFAVGKRGAVHLEGLVIRGNHAASASGPAIGIGRSGGVAADRDPYNLMVVDCEFDEWWQDIHGSDSVGFADRDTGCLDFLALQGVTFTDAREYHVYGLNYCERVLVADCWFGPSTIDGSAYSNPYRTFGQGRSLMRDNVFETGDNGSMRLLSGSTSSDGAVRFVNVVRQRHAHGSSATITIGPDPGMSGAAYAHDIRFVDCRIENGSGVSIRADDSGSNGLYTERIDFINFAFYNCSPFSIGCSASVTHVHSSLRFLNCAGSKNYGGGTVLSLGGTAANYASACIEMHGCGFVWGSGDLEPRFMIGAGMSVSDLASKVGSSDRNHLGKVGNNTINWAYAGSTQSLAAWRTASGHDLNSSVNPDNSLNFVDSGMSAPADGDFHLASDSGPLAGTGYPLPLGVSIDADGYLRSATTPDAGPYEYGATDTPEDPELSSPSTGGQVRTSLSVGLTLGL